MSQSAVNRNGLLVAVGEQVTILGAVTVIAGSGVGRPSGPAAKFVIEPSTI